MENINYRNKNGLIVLKNLMVFLLTTEPILRDSDSKLIQRVYEIYKVDVDNISFSEVIYRIGKNEIPNFESIRRCRQKVQEERPDLRSSIVIQKEKERIETQFYNFALSE